MANLGDHQLTIPVPGMFADTLPEITTDLARELNRGSLQPV
jgi:hypothetical protein